MRREATLEVNLQRSASAAPDSEFRTPDSALRTPSSALRVRPSAHSPLRHAYTVFMAVSILALICSGGLVTSNDAGLSVPDWPTSYGYNMFAFPLSRWIHPGPVRLEHAHRLVATGEGILSIILAVWFAVAEPRRWVRVLGFATLGAIVFQGILGGLRVKLLADWIGIPHGMFAQAFFAFTAFIALTQSRWWERLAQQPKPADIAERLRPLRRHVLAVTILIFVQLGFGAAMRHAHAGLSILDFPTAYGHWWPQVHQADLPAINTERVDTLHLPPTSLAQIHLQMGHRVLASIIFLGVIGAAFAVWRRRAQLPTGLRWLGLTWPLVLATQITLGMYVIWTGKAADVATAHVATGAVSLTWGVLLYAALRRWSVSPVMATAPVGPVPGVAITPEVAAV